MAARVRRALQVSLAVGISVVIVVQVEAQSRTGLIVGQLVTGSGNVLAGATVDYEDSATGRRRVAQTDRSGRFEIVLDPGTYTLRFYTPGLAPSERVAVVVEGGRTVTVHQVMDVPHFRDSIDVAVPTQLTEQLPGAPDAAHLATIIAGVSHGQLEGGWQANGASAAENEFLIDGVLTNSVINGSARVSPSLEFVEHTQVATQAHTAKLRGAAGASINISTKSGSNTFRGDGRYTVRGSRLSGSPVSRLVLSPADSTTVAYVSDEKAPESAHQLDMSFSGPLKLERLWFFVAASGAETSIRKSYGFSSGATPGELKQRTFSNQGFAKINFASPSIAAAASVMVLTHRSRGVLPFYNGIGPNVISSSAISNQNNRTRGYSSRQAVSQTNLTLFPTSTSVLTMRASYVGDGYRDIGIPRITGYTYQTASSASLLPVPLDLQGPAGAQNAPRTFQTLFDNTSRASATVNFNRTFNGVVPHTLSAGVEYQRALNQVDTSFPDGYVSIYWGSVFVAPNGQTGTGAYGYYAVNDLGLKGSVGSNTYSVYLQNDLRVSAHLSLDLGGRLERETIPSFRREIRNSAITFGFLDKVAPRVGLTYRLLHDGKGRLTASWGRFFDWTKYSVARELFGGQTWRTYYRSLEDPTFIPSVNLSNMPGQDLWPGPGVFQDNRVPTFRMIDPALKPTYQNRLNASFEMAITAESTVALHLVHTTLQRPIEDVTASVGGQATYVIGNPGFGLASKMAAFGRTGIVDAPKPVREYRALEAVWRRRLSGGWFTEASYTLSRLYGNYAGLLDSDQVRTPTTESGYFSAQESLSGILREAGNLGRGWDSAEQLWDSHGHFDPKGRLATDRPHVFKAFGSYTAPFGTTVGFFQYAGSGTPISTYVGTSNQAEVFVNGRGDMGRTAFLSQTDVLVQHNMKVLGGKTLRMELNVLNLFNQKTARHVFNSYNRGAGTPRPSSAINLTAIDLRTGYDYKTLVAATPDGKVSLGALDPRYGKADLFNPPLQAYVTAKFLF